MQDAHLIHDRSIPRRGAASLTRPGDERADRRVAERRSSAKLTHVIAVLEAMPQPLLVLSSDGCVLHANGQALALLSDPGVLTIKEGRITAVGGDPKPLSQALRQVDKGVGCVMPLTTVGRKGTRTGLLRLAPVQNNHTFAGAWHTAAAVVVFELRSDADNGAALALLATRYSITATELQVLQLLVAGQRPRHVADQMNIKASTVRTHLRNLYDKTGLRRQVDLLRLLSR